MIPSFLDLWRAKAPKYGTDVRSWMFCGYQQTQTNDACYWRLLRSLALFLSMSWQYQEGIHQQEKSAKCHRALNDMFGLEGRLICLAVSECHCNVSPFYVLKYFSKYWFIFSISSNHIISGKMAEMRSRLVSPARGPGSNRASSVVLLLPLG